MITGLYKFIENTTPKWFQLRLLNTSEWAVAASRYNHAVERKRWRKKHVNDFKGLKGIYKSYLPFRFSLRYLKLLRVSCPHLTVFKHWNLMPYFFLPFALWRLSWSITEQNQAGSPASQEERWWERAGALGSDKHLTGTGGEHSWLLFPQSVAGC